MESLERSGRLRVSRDPLRGIAIDNRTKKRGYEAQLRSASLYWPHAGRVPGTARRRPLLQQRLPTAILRPLSERSTVRTLFAQEAEAICWR